MKFYTTSSKDLISKDMRSAFSDMVQQELAAREPAEGVKLLNAEPEQLVFDLSFKKKQV